MDKNDKPQDPPENEPIRIPADMFDIVARPGEPNGK